MRRIFEGWWVYVGHASEIAEPGDYKTTFLGRQPVIVSRDREGAVHVLLNVCRHRGNAVCREDYGNSMAFRCPYHGWTYANDGRLIGVTGRARYPEGFADGIEGLVPAARVGVYRGLIFASLSDDVPSFEEYLDPVRPYIDLWCDVALAGELRLAHPFPHTYEGNWKMQMENSSDGYHTRFTHESAMKAGSWDPARPGDEPKPAGDNSDLWAGPDPAGSCTRDLGGGHATIDRDAGLAAVFWGRAGRFRNAESYLPRLVERRGEERAAEIMRGRHILVFPNLYLFNHMLRRVEPAAVDRTAVYNHYTIVPEAEDAMNLVNARGVANRLGGSGTFNTDDLEMFLGVQTGSSARRVEWMHLSRGLGDQLEVDGQVIGGPSDEVPQRAFWKQWRALAGAG